MKRCPQCQNLYPDETQYCLGDGQLLISERLPLPSELSAVDEEEVTIIRNDPIVVDLSAANAPNIPQQPSYQIPQPAAERITVKTKSNFGKYLVFLIIGLLLGGGLVLTTLYLSREGFFQNNGAGGNKAASGAANSAQPQRTNAEPKNSDSPVNKRLAVNPEHQKRTAVSDDEFNGRVITLNAYIRSSPSRSSPEIDVLPIDDRLTITSRDDPDSPWFHVVCEHGTSGWMHGNTIEYTK
ncbi:MAG: SH3 domain-containing protein [Acidobacteriota bacterium]|nr:SH3 domain-containing protein [Acidobacteriota bacterium]